MTRNLRALLAALLIALPMMSSCSDATDPLSPAATVQPQDGLIGDLLGGVLHLLRSVITGTDANGDDAYAWIGSAGGTVHTAAYTLIVPPNAVSRSTRFSIEPTNTGTYSVELHAYRRGGFLNLSLIDVGSYGFDRPVTLQMSFANATNVDDASGLVIVYVSRYGVEVQTSAVDLSSKTVRSQLRHFSKYAMAQN